MLPFDLQNELEPSYRCYKGICSRKLPMWLPVIPTSWYPHLGVVPGPCVGAAPSEFHPINKVQQIWWAATSKIRIQKTGSSLWHMLLLILLMPLLWYKLSFCSFTNGNTMWHGIDSQFSDFRETILPTTTWVNMGGAPFLVEHLCKTAAPAKILVATYERSWVR